MLMSCLMAFSHEVPDGESAILDAEAGQEDVSLLDMASSVGRDRSNLGEARGGKIRKIGGALSTGPSPNVERIPWGTRRETKAPAPPDSALRNMGSMAWAGFKLTGFTCSPSYDPMDKWIKLEHGGGGATVRLCVDGSAHVGEHGEFSGKIQKANRASGQRGPDQCTPWTFVNKVQHHLS